jgi:hypothetical protein
MNGYTLAWGDQLGLGRKYDCMTPTLSQAQLEEFRELGMVRLRRAFSAAAATQMRDRLWGGLARQGILRANPATWTVPRPVGFQALTQEGVFDALGSPTLRMALDQLLGPDSWVQPQHWAAPLVSFPESGVKWDVPCRNWHVDFPARGAAAPLMGVRVLAFLDTVAPHGGGTVVAQGSHRIVERLVASGAAGSGRSRDVRALLTQTQEWFATLWSPEPSGNRLERFMASESSIDGVPLRVVELSGEACDVVLMHPWQFHAAAPHCGTMPRLMLSHSVIALHSLLVLFGGAVGKTAAAPV